MSYEKSLHEINEQVESLGEKLYSTHIISLYFQNNKRDFSIDYKDFWSMLAKQTESNGLPDSEKKRLKKSLLSHLNDNIEKIENRIVVYLSKKIYEKSQRYKNLLFCEKYLTIQKSSIKKNKNFFVDKNCDVDSKNETIHTYLDTDIRTLIAYNEFETAYDLYHMVYLFYTNNNKTDDLVRSEIKLRLVKLNLFQSIEESKINTHFFILALKNLISACKEIDSYCDFALSNGKKKFWGNNWYYIFEYIFKLSVICVYLFATFEVEDSHEVIKLFSQLLEHLQCLEDHEIYTLYKDIKQRFNKEYSCINNLYKIRIGEGKCKFAIECEALVNCIKSLPCFLSDFVGDNWDVKKGLCAKFGKKIFFPDRQWNITQWYFKSEKVKNFIGYFAKQAIDFCLANKDNLKKVSSKKMGLLYQNAYKYYQPKLCKYFTPLLLCKVEKKQQRKAIVPLSSNSKLGKIIELNTPVKHKLRKSSNNLPDSSWIENVLSECLNRLNQAAKEHAKILFEIKYTKIEKIYDHFLVYQDFWPDFNFDKKDFLRNGVILFYLNRKISDSFLEEANNFFCKKYDSLYNLINNEIFEKDSFVFVEPNSNVIRKLMESDSKKVFLRFQKIEQKIFDNKQENPILQSIMLWQIFYLFSANKDNLLCSKALAKMAYFRINNGFKSHCIMQKMGKKSSKEINFIEQYSLNYTALRFSISALIEMSKINQDKSFKQMMIFIYAVKYAIKYEFKNFSEHLKMLGSFQDYVINMVGKERHDNLQLKDAFNEKNSTEQQMQFLIFCFPDKSELLDILHTYKFSGCQFSQLFLKYTIDTCVEYFCKLDIKKFLFDDPIYCEALRIFDIAVSLYCGKDIGKNEFNLYVAQYVVKAVKDDLQEKIDSLIKKYCHYIREKLERGILKKLKLSERQNVTWEDVRNEIINICKDTIFNFLKENYKKYFPDLNAQLNCIIREIRKAAGIPGEVFRESNVAKSLQIFKILLESYAKKNKTENHDNISTKGKFLTNEQKIKIIASIKKLFNITDMLNRQRNVRGIDFRSYIANRLKRCNPFGPIDYFVTSCNATEFNQSLFNQKMLNNETGRFIAIPTTKYEEEECKKVLEAFYLTEEFRLHCIIAGFSNCLFLVGDFFPEFKFFGSLYHMQSLAVFSNLFNGITFKGMEQHAWMNGSLTFSMREKFSLIDQPFALENQRKTIVYIEDSFNELKKVKVEELSNNVFKIKKNMTSITNVTINQGTGRAQFPDDPRVEILSTIITNQPCDDEYFNSSQAGTVFLFRSFSTAQQKIVDGIPLNDKEKDLFYYCLLYKFVVTKMYGSKNSYGTLWGIEQLLRAKGEVYLPIADAIQEIVQDECFDMISKIEFHESTYYLMHVVLKYLENKYGFSSGLFSRIFDYLYGKVFEHDYKEILSNYGSKIISQISFVCKKIKNDEFLRHLASEMFNFIEHKNWMEIGLGHTQRILIDYLLSESANSCSPETYDFANRQLRDNDIKDLKKSPENSTKLRTTSKSNYLDNMQIVFLTCVPKSQYACIEMPRIFFDLIKIYLRKLYLEIVEKRLNSNNNINSYKIIKLFCEKDKSVIIKTQERNGFIKCVMSQINNIQMLIENKSIVNTIKNYLLCFKQTWFWCESQKIFGEYKIKNKTTLYKYIFCIVTFLQDPRLNGFSKEMFREKNAINIFEEGSKRIDELVKPPSKLNQYLHFIFNKKLPKNKQEDLLKKNKLEVWLDLYCEMSRSKHCKEALALLMYQDFFKVCFSTIAHAGFEKFHQRLFDIYASLLKKAGLPKIKNPKISSLMYSIKLMEGAKQACKSLREKDSCYSIMYHELEFIAEPLIKKMKNQLSKRILSKEYVLEYLDQYFAYLQNKLQSKLKKDVKFEKEKLYKLKEYMEHVKNKAEFHNQYGFFKKTDEKNGMFKLQVRIRFWFYSWLDSETETDGVFSKKQIKESTLIKVNNLINEFVKELAKNKGFVVDNDDKQEVKKLAIKQFENECMEPFAYGSL